MKKETLIKVVTITILLICVTSAIFISNNIILDMFIYNYILAVVCILAIWLVVLVLSED